jgi:hypothetical protein
VRGDSAVPYDEDNPKAALSNHMGHGTVFNITFLEFSTACATGILEHKIIGDFPQNRPH